MTSDGQLTILRRGNIFLQRYFERFAGKDVVGSDEEVQALAELERTMASIRPLLGSGMSNSEDVQDELAIYRANLVQLRQELARMQESATARRARLFLRRKHLDAAQAWCATSRALG